MFSKHIWRLASKSINIFIKRNEAIWANVELGAPDLNFGITEAFGRCKNPRKVNLGVGTYRDDTGKPYLFPCVIRAEKQLYSMGLNKEHTPITGLAQFCKLSAQFALGSDSKQVSKGQVAVCQTISGSGALRLGAAFLQTFYPGNKVVYVPKPTWVNHKRIFNHSGLEIQEYKYFDPTHQALDFTGMLDDISKIPETSIILFQVTAHNPTGIDPKHEQWDEISNVVKKRNLLPFLDMAYQGFATGDAERDAYPVRKFIKDGHYIILTQSYAKNMGMYGERVGALLIQTDNPKETSKVMSQLKIIIRGMYSNPPINGARIVTKILEDPGLKADWRREFKSIAERFISIRKLLKENLIKVGSIRNWDHLINQIGMYCNSGLDKEQIKKLADEYAVFLTSYGRLSLGGLNSSNVEYVAQAIHNVTK